MLTAMLGWEIEEICRGIVGGGNLFTLQCRQARPRSVIPAKAGIHPRPVVPAQRRAVIPANAGIYPLPIDLKTPQK